MVYLILQIIIGLFLVFTIGFLIGWLLKIIPHKQRIEELEENVLALEKQTHMNSKIYNDRIQELRNELKPYLSSPSGDSGEDMKELHPIFINPLLNKIEELKVLTDHETVSENSSGSVEILPESDEHKDNLKRISGVGNVLEKLLNENGIFYYRQVAELSEEKIESLSRNLGAFHGRILRDNWIGQAQDLHYQEIW